MIPIPALFGIAVFAFALLWAALSDARSLRIPNTISILMLAGFGVLAPLAGFSPGAMALSLAAAAAVGVVLFLFFRRGWIRGGDTKLITVTALWLGAGQLPSFLLWTSLFGGVLALAALAFRAIPPRTAGAMPVWVSHMLGRPLGIPFGIAIAAAGLARLPYSPWMLSAH
ncbi:prepilin peptidase [Paracoccaceae bacterium Fryx2]|nr:prepilin peptidase [Paracoccaceae bacterium Fryx2]